MLIQILISDGSDFILWKKDNSTISIGTFLFNDQNNRIKLEQMCNGRAGPWFSNAKFVEIFRPF